MNTPTRDYCDLIMQTAKQERREVGGRGPGTSLPSLGRQEVGWEQGRRDHC